MCIRSQTRQALFLSLAMTALLGAGFADAQAVGSAFSYQGELRVAGQPADSAHDFRFRLFSAASGGSQIGSTVTANAVAVQDGLFTTQLDFGPAQFAGDAQWLEIAVRPAGSGSFQTLNPRTAVTATPYALGAVAALANSVTSTSIVDGSVQSQDIAAGAIGSAQVDQNQVQRRVSGSCSASQAMRSISATGTVVCGNLGSGTISAVNAGTGLSGGGSSGAVTLNIANGGVGQAQIDDSEVQRRVTGSCLAGQYLRAVASDGSVTCGFDEVGSGWSLEGNANTDPAAHFLGTSDNQALILRVNNRRALRIEPNNLGPNLIGGHPNNSAVEGISSAIIAGGGTATLPNTVTSDNSTVSGGVGNRAHFESTVAGGFRNAATHNASTVGGGVGNTASANVSVVPGGAQNCAAGRGSWAGGFRAKVRPGSNSGNPGLACESVPSAGNGPGDEGTFVWADWGTEPFISTGSNQFLVRATGGVAINTNAPRAPLTVTGQNKWNPTIGNGWGDFTVGDGVRGLAVGVSTGGGGAGSVRLWAKGGAENISFTNATRYPDQLLHIGGDGLVGVGRIAATNALEVNGNASKTTSGSWLANSDARIKTDVQELHDAVDRVMQLRPVRFRYEATYRQAHPQIRDELHYNVIAQEFAEVFPDAVRGSGDYLPGQAKLPQNEILQVDFHPATVLTIAAVQELAIRLQTAEASNAELRERNARIEDRLQRLEALLGGRVAD